MEQEALGECRCLLPMQRDADLRGILWLPRNFTREPVCLASFLPPHQRCHSDSRDKLHPCLSAQAF